MWKNSDPKYGDQIRVCRGFYYHYGIYAADDCVIHFAPAGNSDRIDPENARIITTSLEEFLKSGVLEVRQYNSEENKIKRKPQEIVNCALSHLGEGGYDLINNNCEHFANLCVFGSKSSAQVDRVLHMFFGGLKK